MDKKLYKKAEDLVRESLKECMNFKNNFDLKSTYFSQIENFISVLNTLLGNIKKDSQSSDAEKIPTSTEENQTIKDEININTEKKTPFKTNILSEEIRENATKIAETYMSFDDFPKSAYGFEKAFNSMKKRPEVFLDYLKHFSAKTLEVSYKASELSYQTLAGILQSLKQYALVNQENSTLTKDYLLSISKTKNFNLVKKFLKKSDKEDLKTLLGEIKKTHGDLSSEMDILEKLYF